MMINNIKSFEGAQFDMRHGYSQGATGIFVSGIIWLTAAIVNYNYDAEKSMWALLIGGMMIHPASLLVCKILGVKGNHTDGNPLGKLAMESTFLMLASIPLAIGLFYQKEAWFFQAMLVIIGGRYLTFNTVYGNKLYWILGGVLIFLAYFLFYNHSSPFITLLGGGITELCFGIYLYSKKNI